jgi:RNA polymerase sigma-70 factor, ECF subfamily
MQRFSLRPRREGVMAVTDAEATVDAAARTVVEEVHARIGQPLFGFARRLGLADEEAADVVQDALVRLLRALGSGPPIDDPVAWTYRVAYRLAMDRHRLRRRLQAVSARLVAPPAAQRPADDLLAVWSEVDRLPARQRAVVYLRYRSDLSFDVIGSILGIDASSARSHASRAIAHLRARLGEED